MPERDVKTEEWPERLYARREPDWIREPHLSLFPGAAANEPDREEETYIPRSQVAERLLSEEVCKLAADQLREWADEADETFAYYYRAAADDFDRKAACFEDGQS